MDSVKTFSWTSKAGTSQRAPGSRRPSIATCLNGNPSGASDALDIRSPSRQASAADLRALTSSPIDRPRSRASEATLNMGIDRKASSNTLVGGSDHGRKASLGGQSMLDIRRPALPDFGPPPAAKPPQIHEPYFIMPNHHFSIHDHLKFNPAPPGPLCNCGTWQMWCLPPHLGGCGHMLVQVQMVCGKTTDPDEPHKALAVSCPGVVMKRPVRCAGYMMGLCPTCRTEASVIQTYNTFIAPFFVPKGLTGLKQSDAEMKVGQAWRAHRIAFDAWVQQLRQEKLIHEVPETTSNQ